VLESDKDSEVYEAAVKRMNYNESVLFGKESLGGILIPEAKEALKHLSMPKNIGTESLKKKEMEKTIAKYGSGVFGEKNNPEAEKKLLKEMEQYEKFLEIYKLKTINFFNRYGKILERGLLINKEEKTVIR